MGRIARKVLTCAGIALSAWGCSSSGSTSTSQLAVSADAGDCTQSGAAACDSTLTVMCARFTQCCATVASCQPWATDMARCKARWVESGINCAAPSFASKMACSTVTSDCQEDIPLVACTDVANGTANWPATCSAFWAQFR